MWVIIQGVLVRGSTDQQIMFSKTHYVMVGRMIYVGGLSLYTKWQRWATVWKDEMGKRNKRKMS